MGFTRKFLSLGTVGLIDFRSDKERNAAYARGTRKHTRKAAKAAEQQARYARETARTSAAIAERQGPPPGWYADPHGQPVKRWWDGSVWTEHIQD